MGNRAKLSQEGVVERADGRRLVRIFVYFDAKNSDALKRHCFETGVTLSSFIDKTVATALKSMRAERKAPKPVPRAKRKIKKVARKAVTKVETAPAIAAE